MKKWQRAHHHHHRLEGLLVQYAHLNAEQREEALEVDVLAMAGALDPAHVVRVLQRVIDKLRVHR